jgi:SM-20-related protein
MGRVPRVAGQVAETAFEGESWAAAEGIVDDLACRGFAIQPRAFRESFLQALLSEAETARQEGDYRAAGVGRDGERHGEIRGDQILWLDPHHPTFSQQQYLKALDQLGGLIRRHLYLPVVEAEAHFAFYPPGAFYHRHLDQFQQSPHRLISCLLYLNRDWRKEDGGQLRLYTPDEEGGELAFDVFPEMGTLVCFLSDRIEHEVLPTRRPRTSLAAWLRRRRVL